MSADTERTLVDSFNVIVSTDPITDEQADRLASGLSIWSPVVDGDGSITLTIKAEEGSLRALSFAVFVLIPFHDFLRVNSIEVMTAEAYDQTYGYDFGL